MRVKERRDFVGLAEQTHDRIDHMAAQFVHDSARILSPFRPSCHSQLVVHGGPHHEDFAEPSFTNGFDDGVKRRAVAILIATLQNQLLLLRQFDNLTKIVKLERGRLLKVYMLARIDGHAGVPCMIAHDRLDRDDRASFQHLLC